MAVVLHDLTEGVATITLNRPKALNALDTELAISLSDILHQVERDRTVRVVILRGAGAGFMAGGDLKFFAGMLDREPEQRRAEFRSLIHRFHESVLAIRRMPKPVVAAVHGAVAGAGLSIALACDLTVASDDAYFTLAYCNIGTSPDGGSTFALPRVVGVKKAMEIAMLGDRFDAHTALGLGLLNRVVPTAEFDSEVATLAKRLAGGPTVALAHTKRLINNSLEATVETQLERETESFATCTATEDFPEGITAFLEKRAPRFAGR
jgi:2-(1,2-epoxy-1,2-dihydrophenyl)acetyl-CoA isomerase